MEFNDEKWYVPLERFPNQLYDNKDETIFRCRKKVLDGVSLFMDRPRNYQKLKVKRHAKSKGNNFDLYILLRESDVGDAKWLRSMLNSGTLTDKTAAMTSLVQNDPVHNIDMVEDLLAMANKKGKREAQLAVHSLRELFTLWILPDRPLRYFSQQPLEEEGVDDKLLVLFYYEHLIKQKYSEVLFDYRH